MNNTAIKNNNDISANDVAQFLKDNPAFFLKNEALLADLYLPHASGDAVSLLERQVSILRERNIDMRKRVSELLENGQRNDALFLKTKNLVLELLRTKNINELMLRLKDYCLAEFQVDQVQCLLIANENTHKVTNATVIAEAEVELKFSALLNSDKSVSGNFREQELELLFNNNHHGIASAITQPIVLEGKAIAFLSLGSFDAEYFKSGMDTLFLNFIADILAQLIPRNL